MTFKDYTRTEFIKKFGKSNRYFKVQKRYDFVNDVIVYEVRSIKNKIHENHETIDEILNESE
tara:strand:+ start:974 stop:1159 length:186 start_codon:yes stop_codon:yes gene_type:complete